ncbi:hypothetical protein GCM10008965_05730 [Methylorubrum aminovorans]|nr:hypothetical protein GCM10025880_04260 [Methylorubrum aminovorans]
MHGARTDLAGLVDEQHGVAIEYSSIRARPGKQAVDGPSLDAEFLVQHLRRAPRRSGGENGLAQTVIPGRDQSQDRGHARAGSSLDQRERSWSRGQMGGRTLLVRETGLRTRPIESSRRRSRSSGQVPAVADERVFDGDKLRRRE